MDQEEETTQRRSLTGLTKSIIAAGASATKNRISDSILSDFFPNAVIRGGAATITGMFFRELPGAQMALGEVRSFLRDFKGGISRYLSATQRRNDQLADEIEEVVEVIEKSARQDLRSSEISIGSAADRRRASYIRFVEALEDQDEILSSMDMRLEDLVKEVTTLVDVTSKVWGISQEQLEQIGLNVQIQRMQVEDARRFHAEDEMDQQLEYARSITDPQFNPDLIVKPEPPRQEVEEQDNSLIGRILQFIGGARVLGGGLGVGGAIGAIGGAIATGGGILLGRLVSGIARNAIKFLSGGGIAGLVGGTAIASAGGAGIGRILRFAGGGIARLGIYGLIASGILGGFEEAWETYQAGGSLTDVVGSFMGGFVEQLWEDTKSILSFIGDLIKWAIEPSLETIRERAEADISAIQQKIEEVANRPEEEATGRLGEEIGNRFNDMISNWTGMLTSELERLEGLYEEAVALGDSDAIREIQRQLEEARIRAETVATISENQAVIPTGEIYSPQLDPVMVQQNAELFNETTELFKSQIDRMQRFIEQGRLDVVTEEWLSSLDRQLEAISNMVEITDHERQLMIDELTQRYQNALDSYHDRLDAVMSPVPPGIFSGPHSSIDRMIESMTPSEQGRAIEIYAAEHTGREFDALSSFLTGGGSGSPAVVNSGNTQINQSTIFSPPTEVRPSFNPSMLTGFGMVP